jgi:RNA polymerase sigma-70 factor (ECF subfamily)
MIHETLQFRQIVRDYSDRIGQTARGILGNDQDAEEAVQDVLLKVYHALKYFKGESHISTWIYRITVNTCISLRRKAPRPEVSWDDPKVLAEISRSAKNPEELYQEKEARERAAELTASLADREAQAVTLFYLEELDYEEIGEIMGIPVGSVATILHRGRMHLHLLLLRDEEEKSR